jgi:hypothetical protein
MMSVISYLESLCQKNMHSGCKSQPMKVVYFNPYLAISAQSPKH